MPVHFPKIHPKDFRPGISLFLLTGIILFSYFNLFGISVANSDKVTITTPVFSGEMILAHVLLLIIWGISFFTRKLWKSVYALYLLLALSPLLELTNFGMSFSIGWLSIDLIAFGFLILHLGFNPLIVKNLIKQISGPAESKNTLYPKTITKLEKRFETKTKAQLQYISTSTDFSPEAHVAAKKLLDIKIEE